MRGASLASQTDTGSWRVCIAEYMVGTFGKPQVKVASATDGMDIPEQLKGKRGIIMFDVRVWSDATGHFDLWNGESCAHDCYFNKAYVAVCLGNEDVLGCIA